NLQIVGSEDPAKDYVAEVLKNCGAGAPGSPGFQPANTCAGGGGAAATGGDGSGSSIMVPDAPLPAGKYTEGDPRNDPAYEAYVEKIDATINKALADGKDTESLYRTVGEGAKGTYTAERAAQQKELIDEYLEKYKDVPAE